MIVAVKVEFPPDLRSRWKFRYQALVAYETMSLYLPANENEPIKIPKT